MNKNNWLDEEEKKRVISCLMNIQDKLNAISNELSKDMSYRSYISEKIESVCWDSKCIQNMCKEE